MDYYKILGVSMTASKEEIHAAFRELSRTYHPDRFSESERANAEKRYQGIVKAFNTLKDTSLRENYSKMAMKQAAGAVKRPAVTAEQSSSSATPAAGPNKDPKQVAKQYFEAGQKKAEANQIEQAVECFKRSIYYFPTAEAHFHKGMVELKDKRFHRDSIQSLQEAVKQAPSRVEYRLQLAKAFEGFGMRTRASSVLEQALKTFPGNQKLLAMDEQINPEKYKKGGLGGIFGNILGNKK